MHAKLPSIDAHDNRPKICPPKPCSKRNCRYCQTIDKSSSITDPTSQRKYISRYNVTCQSQNLIYAIQCTKCQKLYVGWSIPNVDSRHACRNTSDLSHKKFTKKVSVITSPPRTNTRVFPMSKPLFWNFAHQPPQIKIAPKGNGWKRNGSTDYIVISPLVSIPKTNVRLSVETSRAPFFIFLFFLQTARYCIIRLLPYFTCC